MATARERRLNLFFMRSIPCGSIVALALACARGGDARLPYPFLATQRAFQPQTLVLMPQSLILWLHDRLIDRTFSELGNTALKVPLPCRSEEHTSELQSRPHLVCRLLLEKKKNITYIY